MKTYISILVSFILTLGAFRADAVIENPNEPIVAHEFHFQKLPRNTTHQAMREAGYILKSIAEGGWDNTRFYNWVGHFQDGRTKAKVMIFPVQANLWCTKDGTPVCRDICYNPVEIIPQEQAREVEPQRCNIGEYIKQAFEYCTSQAQYASCLGQVQQYYPSYYQPMCQHVQRCVSQSTYVNITRICNTTTTTTIINNCQPPACTPAPYCAPVVATTGSVVAPPAGALVNRQGDTNIPYGDNGQLATTAGTNKAVTTAGTAKIVSATTASANQASTGNGKITYLGTQQAKQATIPTASSTTTTAGTMKAATVSTPSVSPVVTTRATPVAPVAKTASVVPPASGLITYQGRVVGSNTASAPVTRAGSMQSVSTVASVPRVNSVPNVNVARNNFVPPASTFRVPAASSIRVPQVVSSVPSVPRVTTNAGPMRVPSVASVPRVSTPSFIPSGGGGGLISYGGNGGGRHK